ncbi:hypothetical protein [Chitinophaga varians]|uniref:hypothetical protein n=1 Tax=Chitinophaga varians TaxID=2202339 RepID=UPI001FEAF9B7|nr:hypothetical protein [Chitinophaga varians]
MHHHVLKQSAAGSLLLPFRRYSDEPQVVHGSGRVLRFYPGFTWETVNPAYNKINTL